MGQWVKEGIKKEIKFLEFNKTTTQQHLCKILKVVPRGKFRALNKYAFKHSERAETVASIMELKILEKEDQTKCKPNRQEEIKIIAEIHEIDSKRTMQRTNKSKGLFFGKIRSTDLCAIKHNKEREDQISQNQRCMRSIKQTPKKSRMF